MNNERDRRRLGDGGEWDDEPEAWRPPGKPGGSSTIQRVYGGTWFVPPESGAPVQRKPRFVHPAAREERQQDQVVRDELLFGFAQPYIDALGADPVQRTVAAPGAAAEDHVHRAAAAGIAGSGQPLPHLERIQEAFGAHDVSDITAHIGGSASDASDAIGAEAFATGNDVAFRGAPDLHTAAHEAAHVVQQRGGVQLKGGVGEAGDSYEQHADAVADAVVRGDSAEALLGPVGAAPPSIGVQRKPAAGAKKTSSKILTKKATVRVGSLDLLFEVKADLQAKDSHIFEQDLIPIDEVSALDSKLSGFGHSVALAFLSGKHEIASFPGVTIQLEGGIGETSFDGGLNAKLGKIGVAFKGTADELLQPDLRGRVSLYVSGTLSTTAFDVRDVLERAAAQEARLGRLDELRKELEAAKLEREAQSRQAATAKRGAGGLRDVRINLPANQPGRRHTFYDRELDLLRDSWRLRDEAKLSDEHVSRLLRQIAEETEAYELEHGRLAKAVAEVRGKAAKKLAASLAKLAASKALGIFFKLIPLIGWAMAIADIADAAELVYDIVQALRRAKLGDGPHDGGGGDDPETSSKGKAGDDPAESGPSPDGGVEEGDGEGYRGTVDGKIAESPEGSEDHGEGGPGGQVSERTGKTKGEGTKSSGDTPSGREGEGSLTAGDAARSWPEERTTIDPDRTPRERELESGASRSVGATGSDSIDVGKQVREERATIDGERPVGRADGATGPATVDVGKQVREERATIGTDRGAEAGAGKRASKRRKPSPKPADAGKDDGKRDRKAKDKPDTLIVLSTDQANRLVIWNGADASLDAAAESEWIGREVKTTDGRTAVIDGVRVLVPGLANVAAEGTRAIVKYNVIFDLTIDGHQTEDRHTLYATPPAGGVGHGTHLRPSGHDDLKQRITAHLTFSEDNVAPTSDKAIELGSMTARILHVQDVEVQHAGGKTYYTFTVQLLPRQVRAANLYLPSHTGNGETWSLVQEEKPFDLRLTVAR